MTKPKKESWGLRRFASQLSFLGFNLLDSYTFMLLQIALIFVAKGQPYDEL